MFVVDAAVLLPHPPHVVTRVVERVHSLPRWCTGLRRVRHPTPPLDAIVGAIKDPGVPPVGCVFTYQTADVRLTLRAHTAERAGGEDAAVVHHIAKGDGVVFTWTFTVEPEGAGSPGAGSPGTGSPGGRTRLRARTALSVDPDHPTAAVRAALCRQVARRAPVDLERLRALLERYEFGKSHALHLPEPGAGVAPSRTVQ